MSSADQAKRDLLFSFNGRISRIQWWCISLVMWFISLIIGGILSLLIVGLLVDRTEADDFRLEATIMLIGAIALAAYPLTALAVKRLNDRNRTHWLLIVFWIPPSMLLLDMLTDFSQKSGINALIFAIMYWGGIIWTIVEFGVLKGRDRSDPGGAGPLASATDL